MGEAGAGRHCSIGLVRGRLAVLLGGAAVASAAVYRVLTRRKPAPAAQPEPAEELKERLAASRAVVAEREEFESGETPVDQAESVPTEVGNRRRDVHERGREAAEQMRRGSNGS